MVMVFMVMLHMALSQKFNHFISAVTVSSPSKYFGETTCITGASSLNSCLFLLTERRRKGPRPAEPHRLEPVHPRPQRPDNRAKTWGETCKTSYRSKLPFFATFFSLLEIQILLLSFLWSVISEDFIAFPQIWFYFEANRLVEVLATPRDFLYGDTIAHLLQIPSQIYPTHRSTRGFHQVYHSVKPW